MIAPRSSSLWHSLRIHGCAWLVASCLLIPGMAGAPGCAPAGPGEYGPEAQRRGEGPGHRAQSPGLTPEQELSLGRQAYAEILQKARVEPPESPDVRRIRRVGERIVKATEIE